MERIRPEHPARGGVTLCTVQCRPTSACARKSSPRGCTLKKQDKTRQASSKRKTAAALETARGPATAGLKRQGVDADCNRPTRVWAAGGGPNPCGGSSYALLPGRPPRLLCFPFSFGLAPHRRARKGNTGKQDEFSVMVSKKKTQEAPWPAGGA